MGSIRYSGQYIGDIHNMQREQITTMRMRYKCKLECGLRDAQMKIKELDEVGLLEGLTGDSHAD